VPAAQFAQDQSSAMDTPRTDRLTEPEEHAGCLNFVELREQLDVLWKVADRLSAHLEAERDEADRRGDADVARAMERGLLQVTRVRNEVRCACHELEACGPRRPNAPERNAA
jgi:hypothetical protein